MRDQHQLCSSYDNHVLCNMPNVQPPHCPTHKIVRLVPGAAQGGAGGKGGRNGGEGDVLFSRFVAGTGEIRHRDRSLFLQNSRRPTFVTKTAIRHRDSQFCPPRNLSPGSMVLGTNSMTFIYSTTKATGPWLGRRRKNMAAGLPATRNRVQYHTIQTWLWSVRAEVYRPMEQCTVRTGAEASHREAGVRGLCCIHGTRLSCTRTSPCRHCGIFPSGRWGRWACHFHCCQTRPARAPWSRATSRAWAG